MKTSIQKRWRRMIAHGLAFALCTPALFSCSAGQVLSDTGNTGAAFTQTEDLDAEKRVVDGANDFAFLFAEALLKTQDKDENFLCSPYSVWLPLAALVNAAEDAETAEILASVNEAGMTPEELNAAVSGTLYELTAVRANENRKEEGLETHDPLQIANAIFVDQKSTLEPDFSRIFAEDYGGSAMRVNFESAEAAETVNRWAADHTDGLITEIVESFAPGTVAAVANAIYFSDRWSWEFDKSETQKDVFYGPAEQTEADFMIHDGEMSYYEDEELQAAALNFAMGGSMVLLLPAQDDPSALLTSFSAQKLTDLQSNLAPREGTLLLPRFEMESGVMNLSQSLSALGVPLFDPQNPVLNRLVQGDNLYISQAVQNAVIKVDEEGTTAAAVTAMAVATGAYLPPDETPFQMNLNRPFAFLLLGPYTAGVRPVLFTGIVNMPQS